jgi:tetratricopeptide (TPR) repeat protein
MSTFEQKKELLLNGILKDFFKKEEISEFLSKQLKSSEQAGLKSEKQVYFQVEDKSNFRTEVDLLITFAESKLENTKFLELLLEIGQFTITFGEFSLAVDIHEKVIAETKNNIDCAITVARAYLALGDIFSRQARWQQSFNNIKKAHLLFEKQNDPKGLANCENLLGTNYGEIGEFKKAKEHYEKSLSLLEKQKDVSLTGKTEINLGIINCMQGNYEASLSYYQRALKNFQKLSDQKRIAEIKHNIGMTFIKMKKYESAINQFDQSVSASLQAGYLPTLGISYVSKAYLYTLMNDFSLASAFGDKAMEICYKTNDKLSIAEVYKVKGIIQRHLSNYDTCENYLLTSLRINKELGNKLNQAETSFELALLYKETNRIDESKSCFNNAIRYFRKINAPGEVEFIQANMN